MLDVALRQAARGAATASLARLREWRERLLGVPVPALPDDAAPGPISIREGELWCRHCGRIIISQRFGKPSAYGDYEPCCDQQQPVPAVSVLRDGEFVVMR